MAIEYQRDIPLDSSDEVINATRQHVRDHIAAIADADDNPHTRSSEVAVWVARHPSNPAMVRVEGYLDAEPDAPYLKDDYDPLTGVDPELFAREVENAQRDEETINGQK